MRKKAVKIGVLDIQGSVIEHVAALEKVGVEVVRVKNIADLDGVAGLIIPGGESTTIGKLLGWYGLGEEIKRRVLDGSLGLWGTCAGAILMAKKIVGRQTADSLGVMDIVVERNAYGRQIDSFECELEWRGAGLGEGAALMRTGVSSPGMKLTDQEFGTSRKGSYKMRGDGGGVAFIPAVFIRAPKIVSVGKGVEVLAEFEGEIVAAREGKMLATSFHPEMTDGVEVHRWWVEMLSRSEGVREN